MYSPYPLFPSPCGAPAPNFHFLKVARPKEFAIAFAMSTPNPFFHPYVPSTIFFVTFSTYRTNLLFFPHASFIIIFVTFSTSHTNHFFSSICAVHYKFTISASETFYTKQHIPYISASPIFPPFFII